MGGVVVTSLTDIGRPIMTQGLGRVMKHGIKPLFGNLEGIRKSVAEGRHAGIAEIILNNRMATISELGDPYAHGTAFERTMDKLTSSFFKWNDFQKQFTFRIVSNRVLDHAVRGMDAAKEAGFGTKIVDRKIPKKEKAYLSMLGLDDGMLDRIGRMYKEFGEDIDGVRVANAEDWTDQRAARTFQAAVMKDVNGTIITKGVGDTPLWGRHPIGSAVLQFRGFALASHQRAMIRGLQEADRNVAGGLIAMASIGMFVAWLKAIESNRQDELPSMADNPGYWIAEGLDRTGMFPLIFEAFNTLEKTQTAPGIYTAFDLPPAGPSFIARVCGFVQ